MEVTLRGSVYAESLDVMNFLNEVVLRYPEAVSFAPGRPAEQFFDVEESLGNVGRYADRRAAEEGRSRSAVLAQLGQYGPTTGLIRDLVAEHLRRDEGVDVPAEAILVTCGCQEAMLILTMGLFDPARDALLVSDPTYIGITGLAQILEVPVVPVATGEEGLDPGAVASAIEEVRRSGRNPRALYDIPDFNNPLGTSLPVASRRRLLRLCREEGVLIFEDNPYGMFSYDHEPLPTLLALDAEEAAESGSVVVYLGSFSKTLFPGLRLGYLVADQRVRSPDGTAGGTLAAALSPIKSLTTVNTTPLAQAVAGGILQRHGGSLRALVEPKLPFYRANRDAMLGGLEKAFRARGIGADQVRWNRPAGGFFLTVDLPFEFDERCLEECAGGYGVIVCPMPFFALQPGRERQIRLSFSYVTEEQIAEGVERLARFVADRIAK
jgi:(S)-3,5-dihydroxyphenylglycine transaminase